MKRVRRNAPGAVMTWERRLPTRRDGRMSSPKFSTGRSIGAREMTVPVVQHERRPKPDGRGPPRALSLPAHSAHAPPRPMLRMTELQHSIGNQAVGRLLQRKLTINQPGDAFEQEADRVADAVMRNMPPSASPATSKTGPVAAPLQRACSCGGTCAECREEETLQRKEASGIAVAGSGAAAPLIVHDVLRSPGQPLDAATRAYFEPRFSFDFS